MRESGSTIENKFFRAELGLQMGVLGNTETITGVPEEWQNLVLLEGYQCDKCGNVSTGRKADLVTHTSEILIYHLELFQYSIKINVIDKATPDLNIQEEMSQEKVWSFKLHGVIYHGGRHANTGHYTSSITSDEKLYTANCSLVTTEKRVNLRCSSTNVHLIPCFIKKNLIY